jgi:hypothetical protein
MRKPVLLLLVTLVVVSLYVGWTFASRRVAALRFEKSLRAKRARAYAGNLETKPSTGVRILHFYSSRGALKRGEKAILCYGVENARSVRIEPGLGDLSPSRNRCLDIVPKKDTKYTLTAEDVDGHAVSESFVVNVTGLR